MSNFVSLNTALSGLRAAQVGIDVTSHNVANANTAGYTRQRVSLTTSTPYTGLHGQMGSGVDVDGIARIRDEFLDLRVAVSNSTLGTLEVKTELLQRAEGLLGEPDFGVTKELNEVWAAFDELALRPADTSVREVVLSALDALASRVRTVATSLENLGADAELQLKDGVERANDTIQQLADLNTTISSIQGSGTGVPNDLLDRRDLLVDELSRLLGTTAGFNDDGTARVSLNGFDLVSGSRANTLTLQADGTLLHPSGGTPSAGGRIAGLQAFTATGGILDGIMDGLDAFVLEMATQINDQHNAGYVYTDGTTPAGAPDGADLFTFTAGQEARTLALDGTLTADDLATAGSDPAQRFDGENATALAALRSPTSGVVVDQVLRGFITDVGAQVASTKRQAEAEAGINAAAQQARRDHHAVSLDEEMVSLMTYQRTYEAAARVATAIDEMLQTLVNRMGLTGR